MRSLSDIQRFVLDAGERAGKTFLQLYLASWALAAGFLNTNSDVPDNSTFNLLFTMDNVKAGVVGVAFSIFMSVGSKQNGANDSASLLPANVDPPQEEG